MQLVAKQPEAKSRLFPLLVSCRYKTPWPSVDDLASNQERCWANWGAKGTPYREPFGIRLDSETMTYECDDSVDLEAWKERIGADTRKGKCEAKVTIGLVRKIVEAAGLDGISKPNLVRKVKAETGATSNYPYDVIDKAEATKAIVRRKCDEHYVVPKPQ